MLIELLTFKNIIINIIIKSGRCFGLKSSILLLLVILSLALCSCSLNDNGALNSVNPNEDNVSAVADVSNSKENQSANSSENEQKTSVNNGNNESLATESEDIGSSSEILIPDDKTIREPAENGYGYVPKSQKVDKSYFNDTLFVGDSITNMFSMFNDAYGLFDDAKFLCSIGLSYGNSLWSMENENNVFPTYRGDKILIEDAVAEMNVKKVYILLGMNDIGVYGIDRSIENMKELVSRILAKSPDVKIYIQSVTPIIRGKERDDLNNAFIAEFNDKLCKACEENKLYFIDICQAMSDSEGFLLDDYCSDIDYMGMHPSYNGCKVWLEYIMTHTK